jgi:hypothetical protein
MLPDTCFSHSRFVFFQPVLLRSRELQSDDIQQFGDFAEKD